MGIIVFYDEKNGSGNIVQTVEDIPGQNFTPAGHDAIKSAKFYNVRPGCEVALYDSPDGNMDDDFCLVNVKKTTPEYTVNTFQRSYDDDIVTVTFIRENGTDKEISRIRIN
jgi:hypothetical protein